MFEFFNPFKPASKPTDKPEVKPPFNDTTDKVEKPIEKPKSKVSFRPNLSEYKKNLVDVDTLRILGEAAHLSKNPSIDITSTIRTPEEQAKTIYDNEKAGNHIVYKAPGKELLKVYTDNKTKSKDVIIALMVKKIAELTKQNQLVSRHCVPESDYIKKNVIDISKGIPNPRDFVKELAKCPEVSKIITPFTALAGSPYTSNKISIDASEQAIHIEF